MATAALLLADPVLPRPLGLVALAAGLAWRRPRVLGAVLLGLLTLLGADLLLLATGGPPAGLGARLRTVAFGAQATVARQVGASTLTVPDPCARYRYRAGLPGHDGNPRDALGRQHLTHPGPDPLTLAVTGDSVLDRGFANELATALATADVPHDLLDASVFGYDWADAACRLAELGAELGAEPGAARVDVALVGLCLNDLPLPPTVEVDVGAGLHRYDWVSFTQPTGPVLAPPLLVDPTNPWLRTHGHDLDVRHGGAVVRGVTGDVLRPLVDTLQTGNAAARLAELVTTARQAAHHPVFVVLPFVYAPQPDPTDPLLDWTLDTLAAQGVTALDLRPLLREHDTETVGVVGRAGPVNVRGTPHDIVHLPHHTLGLVADAALALVAAETGRPLDAARAAAATRAGARFPLPTKGCVPRPLTPDPARPGVWQAHSACAPPPAHRGPSAPGG